MAIVKIRGGKGKAMLSAGNSSKKRRTGLWMRREVEADDLNLGRRCEDSRWTGWKYPTLKKCQKWGFVSLDSSETELKMSRRISAAVISPLLSSSAAVAAEQKQIFPHLKLPMRQTSQIPQFISPLSSSGLLRSLRAFIFYHNGQLTPSLPWDYKNILEHHQKCTCTERLDSEIAQSKTDSRGESSCGSETLNYPWTSVSPAVPPWSLIYMI